MHPKYVFRFFSYIDRNAPGGCWEWTGACDSQKRGVYRAPGPDGTPVCNKAYRFCWYIVTGEWPKQSLLHSCDNPLCCNPEHLREGSDQDNSDDKVSRGRTCHGAKHHRARLTDSSVKLIRGMLSAGWTQDAVAAHFGTTRGPIKAIALGITWRHVIGATAPDGPVPARKKGGLAGELSFRSKLSDEKVRAIRTARGTVSARELAATHGVRELAIYDIWSGKTWKHVT